MFEEYSCDDRFEELHDALYRVARGDSWAIVVKSNPDEITSNTFLIQTLFTNPSCRGGGNASLLMGKLADLADRSEATLALKAASFDENDLSDDQLVKFYERFGFILMDSKNLWMERAPK